MDKYIIELIGTYFLMLSIGLTILQGLGLFGPIAVGMTLIGVIYMGGHISKAHYNPAVTLAFFICKKIKKSDVLGYLGAQILGAILSTLTVVFLLEEGSHLVEVAKIDISVQILPIFLAELLGTFILCMVILNVAIAKNTAGNSFYGVAIGFTVIGLAYGFGSISGAALNPAVAIGMGLIGLVSWSNLWLFFIANFMGGALAAFVFKMTTEIQD